MFDFELFDIERISFFVFKSFVAIFILLKSVKEPFTPFYGKIIQNNAVNFKFSIGHNSNKTFSIEKWKKMSKADKPRKVNIIDVIGGIVAIGIGIILILVAIILYIMMLPSSWAGIHSIYLVPVTVVFIVIGIGYIGWKANRIAKGKS